MRKLLQYAMLLATLALSLPGFAQESGPVTRFAKQAVLALPGSANDAELLLGEPIARRARTVSSVHDVSYTILVTDLEYPGLLLQYMKPVDREESLFAVVLRTRDVSLGSGTSALRVGDPIRRLPNILGNPDRRTRNRLVFFDEEVYCSWVVDVRISKGVVAELGMIAEVDDEWPSQTVPAYFIHGN